MPLKNIKDKLYSRSSTIENRSASPSALDPHNVPQPGQPQKTDQKTKDWQKGGEVTALQTKTLSRLVIGVVILLIIIGIGFLVYLYQKSAFSEKNLILTFDFPETIEANQEFPLKLLYHNNNRADLHNCVLKIIHPANLEITEIISEADGADDQTVNFSFAEIAGGDNGTLEMKAVFNEKEEGLAYLKSILTCADKQGKAETIKEVQQELLIQSSQISLELEADRQASSGDVVNYRLTITNNTEENLNGLEARFEYPKGFKFVSGSLEPADETNKIFKFATLAPRKAIQIQVSGSLTGAINETKKIKAQVGVKRGENFSLMAESESQTEVINSPLIINQQTEGSLTRIDAGEPIKYHIDYKNTSELPLTNAVITVRLEGEAIDYNSITPQDGGEFDAGARTITWRPGNLPALAAIKPQQEGSVGFSLSVVSHIPSEKSTDKNFEVISTAQIDSPDIATPTASNKVISSDKNVVKLNSKVFFDVLGLYHDRPISNSGPLPPRVGEETTYTIHYQITNINNDLKKILVKTQLPDYVEWKGNTYPARAQEISFDERTRDLIWEINTIPALTGTEEPKKEIIFQVGLKPQEFQIGQEPIILNPSVLTAEDSFTGASYEIQGSAITTELKDDTSILSTETQVSR